MKNLCNDGGVIYVTDKGYMDYKSLYDMDILGSKFVTRLKSNSAYECVYDKVLLDKDNGVLSDTLIKLTGAKTKKSYPKILRVVKYEDKETGKVYEFLTNDMWRSASDIAAIYKERWEVELFFKWIKQHLKVKSFWGTSMNAVYIQLWTALILSILLWINKTLNSIDATAYQLLTIAKNALLLKTSLAILCSTILPHKLKGT
jgi:IS4 transposase